MGVFSRVVDGLTLSFAAGAARFIDQETGSEWDITGQAVPGEMRGTTLTQTHHLGTFWFAWSTCQPETDLVDE